MLEGPPDSIYILEKLDGECVGTSKLDEEQVVLNEVVTKCRFGKQTVCHAVGEGMLGVKTRHSADAAAFRRSKQRMRSCPICSPVSSVHIYIRTDCSFQALCAYGHHRVRRFKDFWRD
jgi:hypothetical protein